MSKHHNILHSIYFAVCYFLTMSTTTTKAMKVVVTGANGFLASHIVKQLLEKGHTVHACVRDASQTDRVAHLQNLDHADSHLKLFSSGDLAQPQDQFDAPMEGCDAVFHAATPLNVKLGASASDGESDIYKPAMVSTQEILDCISRHPSVQTLILTSSMSAVAPQPEPPMKDESHWSDPEAQKARGSWYGATKTVQEQMVTKWVQEKKAGEFRYVAICPTMVLGPSLNHNAAASGTMGKLLDWLQTGDKCGTKVPNDSMSWIHVEDCAAMHVAALEQPHTSGRYMALVESWHWNELLSCMKQVYPKLPDFVPIPDQDKITPTKFNLQKMNSLGVKVRSMETILKESVDFLEAAGALK
jgi:cinnamoyl-CoA reductase